jgi:hypothetical protein
MVTPLKHVEVAIEDTLSDLLVDLDKRAHHRAVHASTAQIAGELQELFGQRLVAAISGVSDEKSVGRWARGEREPRGDSERRLRDAFQIVSLLALADSPTMARAWFVGMNPHLRDRAPFAVLSENPENSAQVLAAAKAFVVNG